MNNVNDHDILVLDWETHYDPKTYSLSKMTTTEYVRDPRFKAHGCAVKFNANPTEWISHDDIPSYLAKVDWTQTALAAHNAAFDGLILSHHYGVVPCFYYDTLSMSRGEFGVLGNIKHNLNALAERLGLGAKIAGVLDSAAGIRDLPPALEMQMAAYAIQDVDLTYAALTKLLDDYPEEELRIIDMTLRAYCDPKFVIDRALTLRLLKEEVREKRRLLKSCGVPKSVLSSNKKFAEHLQQLGIEPPTKTSLQTGKETFAFSKDDLEFQKLFDDYPDHEALFKARLAAKSTIGETRAHRLYRHGIPALPIMMNYCGAHTHRWTGGDSMNPQNFPREGEIRHVLRAPPGYKIVVVDSAQIEARMTAWFAGQDDLLSQFANKEDPYSKMASRVYGYEVNKYDHKVERFVGKTLVLGLGYGMGAPKLARTLRSGKGGMVVKISDDDSIRAVRIYRSTNYKIPETWRLLDDVLRAMVLGTDVEMLDGNLIFTGTEIWTPNGLAMHYPGLSAKRKGDLLYDFTYLGKRGTPVKIWGGALLENVIQNLSRTTVAGQALKIAECYPVLLLAHDEVVYLAKADEAEEALTYGINVLSIPPAWCSDVPLAAEGGFADHYKKY